MKFKRKHVKFIFFIILSMLFVNCKPLSKGQTVKSYPTPNFSSQEEQENSSAQQFFEKHYVKTEYPKFIGEIKYSDGGFQFGKKDFVFYSNSENNEHKLIFQKGLLYPGVLHIDTMKMCCIEELTCFPHNPKIKRFKFIMSEKIGSVYMMNPSAYLFELTNEDVDQYVTWETFIENAKLTFIKRGWTLI